MACVLQGFTNGVIKNQNDLIVGFFDVANNNLHVDGFVDDCWCDSWDLAFDIINELLRGKL